MWLPINSQQRQTTKFQVSTTKLFLQDEIVNLDDFTELSDESIFKLELLPMQPYEEDLVTLMDITVEMNLDLRVVARNGYTFLDYLSDIGGMQSMLISAVAYFMAIWNYNYFDNYMVTRLFKMRQRRAEHSNEAGLDDMKRTTSA